MRHKISGRKFNRPTAHRWMMYRNLVTDLLKHEKLTITVAKAKEVRGLAEKMITLGKEGGLSSRRRALAFVIDEMVVGKVFTEIAPRYKERPGGYTRITKIRIRQGDGAPMVQLELVK